jgi:hypothetical protein
MGWYCRTLSAAVVLAPIHGTGRPAIRVAVKSRHAAALVLVGWCLMLPPLADEVKPPVPHRTVALSAPLSEWCLVQCFDTTQQCESMRQNWYDDGSHKLDVLLSYDGKFTLSLRGVFAELFVRCVAAADPGVKGRKAGSKCFVPPPGIGREQNLKSRAKDAR